MWTSKSTLRARLPVFDEIIRGGQVPVTLGSDTDGVHGAEIFQITYASAFWRRVWNHAFTSSHYLDSRPIIITQ